jgi:hypothetical protein
MLLEISGGVDLDLEEPAGCRSYHVKLAGCLLRLRLNRRYQLI